MTRSMDDAPSSYEFATPPLIRFGAGRLAELGDLAGLWGRRAWIVAGRHVLADADVSRRIEESLSASGIDARIVATSVGEPTVEHLASALEEISPLDTDGVLLIAVGGGATIDLAKALAAMATNAAGQLPSAAPTRADLEALIIDHLEGVGRGLAIRRWPLPLIAVPTTAGTGAEATRNAVISCPRRRFKKSMRSPMMVPRAAIIDPDLTASCNRDTIAASGLDCITQLIESFICRFRKPLPRAVVLESLPRALRSLPRLLAHAGSREPADPELAGADRAALSHAAFCSGMALANSGLGLAHGVAAALGTDPGTPHGLACAVMLPAAVRVNRDVARDDFALLERAIDPDASRNDSAAADAFVARIERLCDEAGIPRRLSEIGVTPDGIDWLTDQSGGSSMRGNPLQLDRQALRQLLASLL